MAISTVTYKTTCKLSCCLGSSVILCVNKNLVTADNTSADNNVGFVTGTLRGQENFQNSCFGTYTQYVITFDDSQLIDGALLNETSIHGVLCNDCGTQYMKFLAQAGGGGGSSCDCFEPLFNSTCNGTITSNAFGIDPTILIPSYTIPAGTFSTAGSRVDFTAFGDYSATAGGSGITGAILEVFIVLGSTNLTNVFSPGAVEWVFNVGANSSKIASWSIKGSITPDVADTSKLKWNLVGLGAYYPDVGGVSAIQAPTALNGTVTAAWGSSALFSVLGETSGITGGTATITCRGVTIDRIGVPLSVPGCG